MTIVPGCADLLAERIAASGPISFREFMETALYDPAEGYYSAHAAIGEGGDFVTAPSISPLFARAVARAFAADASHLDGPLVFLEAAASSGSFLADFRGELLDVDSFVAGRTRLWALESSRLGRESIERTGAAERVFSEVSQIPEKSITGWVFSNELYDALPVHRVQMRDGRLVALGVTTERRPARVGLGLSPSGPSEVRFAWTTMPAPSELSDYLSRFAVDLAEGQIAEVNLDAAPLHRALCRSIAKGRIVSIDYGHRAAVLYHSHARPAGTLAVHARGRRGGDPLETPGLVDLTAHVNWDELISAGGDEGLVSQPVRRLSRFLIESGLFEDASRDKLAAMRLLDPDGLGDALSVLIQSKGV
jgi:SAM-dependent MidA family methyltransferase